MFESVEITNFRCFEQFRLDDLERVNLLAGMNSAGKTALLEALFLLIGAENIKLVVNISGFRGISKLGGSIEDITGLLWEPLFYDLDTDRTIRIEGRLESGGSHVVKLSLLPVSSQEVAQLGFDAESKLGMESSPTTPKMLHLEYRSPDRHSELDMKLDSRRGPVIEPAPEPPPFPGYFLIARKRFEPETEAQLYGNLVRSKRSYDIVEALKTVDDRLSSLQTVQAGGQAMIFGDVGLDQMLPLPLLGDGLDRLTSILLRIANSPAGVVLIDEVENGIHHSVLDSLWKTIAHAASPVSFDTQVFATTHSYECIRSAHRIFASTEDYDFRLHRLDRIDHATDAVTYDRDSLEAAIKANFEVR